MWDTDRNLGRMHRQRAARQRGAAAVEFAMLASMFLALVFGMLEVARMMYLFSTLQEVTRRAAAMAVNEAFDQGTQDSIRRRAVFPDREGNLVLGNPVTPAHLRLDYLSLSRNAAGVLSMTPVSPLPASPAANRLNCMADPYGASCIRFVRVQICQPDGAALCTSVPYRMLFPLIDFSGLKLPRSTTTAPAQTMGYTAGTVPEQ